MLCALSCISLYVSALMAGAVITFDEPKYDFGTIQEDGGSVSHDFRFTNTGSEALVVVDVRTTCGCTVPQYPHEPIAPGQEGFIKVTYNPKGRPGKFSKGIYVTTNTVPDKAVLRISGMVDSEDAAESVVYAYNIGDLKLRTLSASFFQTPKGADRTYRIEVMNGSDKPMTPSVGNCPAYISAEFVPATLPAGGKGELVVVYHPDLASDWGLIKDELRIDLGDGHSADTFNTITVSANVVENFRLLSAEELANAPEIVVSPNVLDFGIMRDNRKVKQTVQIENRGKSPLIIRKIGNSNKLISVKAKSMTVKPGKTTELEIEINPELARASLLNSRVVIISNSPKNSNTSVRVLGKIE